VETCLLNRWWWWNKTKFYPHLYTSWISARTNRGFKGSAKKGGYCQGFTKLHSGQVRTDSSSRYLKNILIAIPPRTTLDLSWEASAWWRRPWVTISDLDLRRKPRRVCFRLPPGLSIFYIIFLLCYLLVSLLWLVYIADPCIILVQFWNQPRSLQTPFLSLSSWFQTFLVLLKLGPLGVMRAQHISWGRVLSEFISRIWNPLFCYQNLTLRVFTKRLYLST
jgi:hypothetical protein